MFIVLTCVKGVAELHLQQGKLLQACSLSADSTVLGAQAVEQVLHLHPAVKRKSDDHLRLRKWKTLIKSIKTMTSVSIDSCKLSKVGLVYLADDFLTDHQAKLH